jgi:hypothetical protein
MFETKQVLKESLARTKELLSSETIRANSLSRDLTDARAELQIARDALKETRHRLQDSYNQNQKHEKTILELRQSARKGSVPWLSSGTGSNGAGGDSNTDSSFSLPSLSRSSTADSAMSTATTATTANGLRELRLGRSTSQKKREPPPTFAKRSSSLATQAILTTENQAPVDNEALLLELVNAKTAEAVARQELEELRAKFESMKRAMGVVSTPSATTPIGSKSAGTTPQGTPPIATSGAVGGFWSGWKRSVSTNNVSLGSG